MATVILRLSNYCLSINQNKGLFCNVSAGLYIYQRFRSWLFKFKIFSQVACEFTLKLIGFFVLFVVLIKLL